MKFWLEVSSLHEIKNFLPLCLLYFTKSVLSSTIQFPLEGDYLMDCMIGGYSTFCDKNFQISENTLAFLW